MITYRFRLPKNVNMKTRMSADEFKKRYVRGRLKLLDGRTIKATVVDQPVQTTGCYSACWPMKADGVGVEMSQIPEAMAADVASGVPTEYCPETGAPIFTSAIHRKKWAEANGYYVCTPKGSSSSQDPVRLDQREIEARAMAGKSVRKCD